MNMNMNYAAQQQQPQYPPKQINPSTQIPANQQHLNGNYQQNLTSGIDAMNLNQNNQKLNSQMPPPPMNSVNNFNANNVPLQIQNFPPPASMNFPNQLQNRAMGQPPTSIGQQIPPNVLNPSTNSTNQVMPPGMSPMMPPLPAMPESQNRPPSTMTSSSMIQSNMGSPPSSMAQPPMVQSNMGRTSVPPMGMPIQPPMIQPPSSLAQPQMTQSAHAPNGPHSTLPAQAQINQLPTSIGQLGMGLPPMAQPPLGGGPTSNIQSALGPLPQMAPPTSANNNHPNMPPMIQSQRPPSNLPPQNLMGQPPNAMGQPPNSMGLPPNTMGQPPNAMGQPPNMMMGQQQNPKLMNQPPMGYPAQFKSAPGAPMYPQPTSMPPNLTGPQPNNPYNYPPGPNDNMHQYQQQQQPPPQQQQQQMNYPPQVGLPKMAGGMPHLNQNSMMYSQAPPAPRKLDPDQMPNPIQVLIENQKMVGGVFATNQAGLLPPLVTTKYVTQDQGNSNPRFVRSSMYTVPVTPELLKSTAVPFSLIISPMAKTAKNELPPPIVNFGELGPIRCIRCKAYMSPNMQFIDAGRRFQCLLCKAITEVPTEYFQHLDHTGQRVDKYERPELVLGTYEFIATKDYCRDSTFPNPPAFIFIIDVSYNNIKSGLVDLLCREIKEIINNLPIDEGHDKSKAQVGFITYNNVVHFYNVKNSLTQPQMMIVGDLQEMFMPLLDGFLCTPDESIQVIDALMKQIPVMFSQTKETETILLPAIQAGIEALKASKCSGKLLVFNSSLPIGDAPGKLRNRDDRKLLGTEKEKQILLPQSQAYEELGKQAVQIGASVDLFIFNNSYIDLATIGQVSKLTGGEIYKYTYFQAEIDGHRLKKDLIANISRPIAFDAVMRVRTSAGVRPTDFYGHYYMSNTTDLELASIDSEKSIAIEIKHDDKLTPDENLYIQIALLYTSCSGQRRLRIMNLALKTTNIIADIFKACDVDVITLFYAKQAMIKLLELTPRQVKDNIIHRSSQILACYRKHCTSPTSAGQLILPECMKLLPLYVSCLLKNDSISGGSDMTCDDRSYIMQYVLSLDLPTAYIFFYPRLLQIYPLDLENDENLDLDVPIPIRCSYEKMNEDGAFILENGIYLFVWLGNGLPASFLLDCFGVQHTQQVNTERFYVKNDTKIGKEINDIIDNVISRRKKCMKIVLLKQEDKLENIFRHFLVEDRGSDGTSGYVDFLCHMHKEIKDLLN